jgi:ribosome-binding ATPase YchF (GTP1/OBG family)
MWRATADPLRDIETVNLELILADITTVEKRFGSLEKEIRAGKKESAVEAEAAEKILAVLHAGELGARANLTPEEKCGKKSASALDETNSVRPQSRSGRAQSRRDGRKRR